MIPLMLVALAGHVQPTLAATETGEGEVVLSPVHYELAVDLDYSADTLHGKARIVLENPSGGPVRDASLLLYRLLRVTDVRSEHGGRLEFSQTVTPFTDFGRLQVNRILVRLPRLLRPRARTTIEIEYEGHLLGYAETGMRYVQDRIDPDFTILRDDSYAFPRSGQPSVAVNRAAPEWSYTYSARITVPESLTVVNGGRLEARELHEGKATYHYTSIKPSWRMDFAVGEYASLTREPIRVYYLEEDESGAAGVAEAAEKAMGLFRTWFGPLRGETALSFIEIPDGWGSQTDATAIIQSAAAFRDPKRHREVYHEVSHLWGVSATDRPSPRWEEGLASFLEFLVAEKVTGEPQVDARADQLIEWLRAELPNHPEWRQVPLIDYGRTNLTDLSYSVGALLFDLLYRLAGAEAFNQIIGGYYAEFNVLGGSTEDLVKLAAKTSPADVRALFDDWVYTCGWAERVVEHRGVGELAEWYRSARR